MTRSCPECGSNDLRSMNVGGGITHWKCNKCGYMGSVEVDFPDESLKKMKETERLTNQGRRYVVSDYNSKIDIGSRPWKNSFETLPYHPQDLNN